jgi:hypothetical protein
MARGVGSPHTRRGWVWHIALTMQALTTDSREETLELIATCEVSVVADYRIRSITRSHLMCVHALSLFAYMWHRTRTRTRA